MPMRNATSASEKKKREESVEWNGGHSQLFLFFAALGPLCMFDSWLTGWLVCYYLHIYYILLQVDLFGELPAWEFGSWRGRAPLERRFSGFGFVGLFLRYGQVNAKG
jgi:hypothetical protein